jgi:hypothetical protein
MCARRCQRGYVPQQHEEESVDLLFLGLLIGFFALTAGLVRLCEKV